MASDDEDLDYSQLTSEQNRKEKKAGGWQSMGLDSVIMKGISRKGFKMPTPIQRKTIPCILDGKDVVAMSRTGSGKTAAFVIPMLQRLKARNNQGIRALLIAPTRELAIQTFKVVKEIGKYTGMKFAVLVGGDSMDDQFSTIHERPDVLVATPGRLLHLVIEMDLRMHHVEYVVFDEADRLFEMGFAEQLSETLKRIPESRQTLLFSATLPKMLVDFAKAGLSDPMLVRLDVDEKISERLSMAFMLCRPDEKLSTLIYLARKADEDGEQTLVFCATMKHVEFVVALLERAAIPCSYIYSQLDPIARKLNIQRFHNKETRILIVTDVAARGVDIPLLDKVINMHFPPKAKLFVHRAGRVARAGRKGLAISLVSNDELPYMCDLFLFLGKPIRFAKYGDTYDERVTMVGRVPETIVQLETDFIDAALNNNDEMFDMRHKSENAMKKYITTRQPPSSESTRRVKEELREKASECAGHPLVVLEGDKQSMDILNRLANYKSNATIFELNTGGKALSAQVMKEKRRQHELHIRDIKEKKEKAHSERDALDAEKEADRPDIEQADDAELTAAFANVIGRGAERGGSRKRDRVAERAAERDKHFISYTPADMNQERQLAVDRTDFARVAAQAEVDIIADDEKGMYKNKNAPKWDRKKKKFVSQQSDDPAKKKIRTENGTWVPATYKSGRYDDWVKKQKLGFQNNDDGEGGQVVDMTDGDKPQFNRRKQYSKPKRGRGGANEPKEELRSKEQIMKTRRKAQKLQDYMAHRRQENAKTKMGGAKGKNGGPGGGNKFGKAGTGGGRAGGGGKRGGKG